MVSAEVITPKGVKDWRKRGFLNSNEGLFCEDCNISYKDEEYKILYKHKKIGYFFYADPNEIGLLWLVCHDCLFKKIKKIAAGEELDLLILDEDNEYTCKFYPHETHDDDDDDDNGSYTDFDLGDLDKF